MKRLRSRGPPGRGAVDLSVDRCLLQPGEGRLLTPGIDKLVRLVVGPARWAPPQVSAEGMTEQGKQNCPLDGGTLRTKGWLKLCPQARQWVVKVASRANGSCLMIASAGQIAHVRVVGFHWQMLLARVDYHLDWAHLLRQVSDLSSPSRPPPPCTAANTIMTSPFGSSNCQLGSVRHVRLFNLAPESRNLQIWCRLLTTPAKA